MKFALILLCFLSGSDDRTKVEINRPVPSLYTSGKFKKVLNQPLPPESETWSFRWKRLELREVLSDVQEVFLISVLLDRRIDPNQRLDGALKEINSP